jgi:hypothetical protein
MTMHHYRSLYDRDLTHAYPEWVESGLQPDFKYHGHNCYAYLLAKYGTTAITTTTMLNSCHQNIEEQTHQPVPDGYSNSRRREEAVTDKIEPGQKQGEQEQNQDTSAESRVTIDGGAVVVEEGQEQEHGYEYVDVVDTFDFVTVQLYEGYSHAEYRNTVLGSKRALNRDVIR